MIHSKISQENQFNPPWIFKSTKLYSAKIHYMSCLLFKFHMLMYVLIYLEKYQQNVIL
jgi:hypothetical protein